MISAPRERNGSTHPPYYCAECDRAHDGTEHDRRKMYGKRGVTRSGLAYVWSERCGEYHVAPNGQTVPIPRRSRWSLDWPMPDSVALDVRDLDSGRALRGAIAGPLRTFTIATYDGANDRVAHLRTAILASH